MIKDPMQKLNLKANLCLCLLLIIIGNELNNICFTSNGNRMPVKTVDAKIDNETHFSYTEVTEVNYWGLSDFSIETEEHILKFSVGDLMSVIALSAIAISIFRYVKPKKEKPLTP